MKDGIDGRGVAARGIASLLSAVAGFAWTVDLGVSNVLTKTFVETATHHEKVDLLCRWDVGGRKSGQPGGTRTPDIRLRRSVLYPVELRAVLEI
jgi:hypothetical protein